MPEEQEIQTADELSSLDFSTISDTRKKAMLFALKKSLGIVSQAAKSAGIARETHYNWLKEDAAYKDAVKLVAESAVDFAESKLFQLIDGVKMVLPDGKTVYTVPPNTAATIFFLKTRAKSRGYIERFQLQDISQDEVESTLDV